MEPNRGTRCDLLIGDRCCLSIMIEHVPRIIPGHGGECGEGLLSCYGSAAPIELKTKGLAEGGQRPLGGIGLRGLKGNVMHLARECASAFPAAMTLANDACPIGLYRQPHPGDIDGKEDAFVLSGERTARFNGLSRPAIKAKDAVGLRDGIPALKITELPSIMGLSCADMPVIGLTPERSHL